MLRGTSMPAASVRRVLHATHAVATVALLATGLLLEFPELRGLAIGGYGRSVVFVHLGAGGFFAGLPLLALAVAHRALLEELRRRLGPPDPWRWRKSHIVGSLAAVALLSGSGVLLWGDAHVSVFVGDASRAVHVALTVLIAVTLPIHLAMARRKILARVKEWLGGAGPADGFFDPDEG